MYRFTKVRTKATSPYVTRMIMSNKSVTFNIHSMLADYIDDSTWICKSCYIYREGLFFRNYA